MLYMYKKLTLNFFIIKNNNENIFSIQLSILYILSNNLKRNNYKFI